MNDEQLPGNGSTEPVGEFEAAEGAEAAAVAEPEAVEPAAVAASSAADADLLALIDRLAGLLERSDLTELEVEAGGTGLVLRKPVAAAAAAVVAVPAVEVAAPVAVAASESPPARPAINPAMFSVEWVLFFSPVAVSRPCPPSCRNTSATLSSRLPPPSGVSRSLPMRYAKCFMCQAIILLTASVPLLAGSPLWPSS